MGGYLVFIYNIKKPLANVLLAINYSFHNHFKKTKFKNI